MYKQSVLVVDDEVKARRGLSKLLESKQYESV